MRGPPLPAPWPARRGTLLAVPGRWQPTLLGALALALAGLGATGWLAPGAWPLPGPTTLLHGRCIGAMQLGLACALWQAWRGAGDEALVLAPSRALAVGAAVQAAASLLAALSPASGDAPGRAWGWAAGAAAVATLAFAVGRGSTGVSAPAERPARSWLALSGAAALTALVLTFAPAHAAAGWPWSLQTVQAAACAGPFAALATLLQAVAHERRRYVRRALLPPLMVLAVGVLAPSMWHAATQVGAFPAQRIGSWLWLAGFGSLAAAAAALGLQLRPRTG